MLQNRSSSAGSAHANTEASVSGHCLDSCGYGMKCARKRGNFSKSEKEWDLQDFCQCGVILRLRQNLELS